MYYLICKYLITALVIVIASETAKVSDKFGALIISLPLMTVLTLVWLYLDGVGQEKVSNHSYYTFWYVLPTLPMFLIFPSLLQKYGFWIALGVSCVFTIVLFFPYAMLLKYFGIELFP